MMLKSSTSARFSLISATRAGVVRVAMFAVDENNFQAGRPDRELDMGER
jgi:hypothetical protein